MARTEDELAKAIQETYAQAMKEVKEKLDDFIAKHKAKDARMKKQVEEGKISAADYKDWQKGQLFAQKQWKQKLKDVTRIYTTADERAREIISSKRIDAFADAANHVAYEIERDQGFSGAVSFNLYDSRTVEKLLKDDPQMLPEWKINEPKDYVWNYKRVKNAVTQGIIQGESVGQIGKRLSEELSTSNARKMDLFARTAVNGAQNAGRVERMRESVSMGIDVKKKWLATLDKKTRDTHRDLDGKEQDVDKPFLIGEKKIYYPGDPKAPAELVYNCRCTLTYSYPKYKSMQDAGKRRDQETGAVIPNTTYREWEATKKGISPKKEKKRQLIEEQKSTDQKSVSNEVSKEETSSIRHEHYSSGTMQMYDEAKEWAADAFIDELDGLRESWGNVQSQVDAINTFEKEIPSYMDGVRSAIQQHEFTTTTDSSAVMHILEDGRFKTQIETGESHGYKDIQMRKRAADELFAFGERLDIPDTDYEVYGFLGNAPRAKMYGDCRIVLKKENMISRTTMTIGDSLELVQEGLSPFASRVDDPNITSMGNSIFSHSVPNAPQRLQDIQRDFASIAQNGYLASGNYIELQYHGGVTLDDIDYIEISRRDINADAIDKLAEMNGVRIKWRK